jgi:hypothetical protein
MDPLGPACLAALSQCNLPSSSRSYKYIHTAIILTVVRTYHWRNYYGKLYYLVGARNVPRKPSLY